LDSISIVIPAYNERERLPATLEAVLAFLARTGWRSVEVVVVDDGSTDGTAGFVEEFSSTHPEVRLLRNPGNRGKGYSVRHGMLAAGGDWVLFTDADLSAPIEELDKLLAAAMRHQAAVAFGSRGLDRSMIGVRQSAAREYAGRFFNLIMRLLTGLPYWDTQCGFKLFRADAARAVFSRQRIPGFGFDVEALFLSRRFGFAALEVPVRWNHSEGTKVRVLRDGLNMFGDLVRIRWNQLCGRYPKFVTKTAC